MSSDETASSDKTVSSPETADAGQSLVVTNLFAGYRGIPVVRELNLQVRPGEVVALLGPNGAGKSTFVRTVSTLLRPDAGTLRVGGYDVALQPVRRHAHRRPLRRSGSAVPALRQGEPGARRRL